ncbi:MAG: hypothetical protein AAFX93_02970 [Verrucomicrobiota bacterium]
MTTHVKYISDSLFTDASVLADQLLERSPVMRGKIAMAVGCRPNQVHEHLVEVIRFMQLVSNSPTTLTPSLRVDLVWHEFILFTREYARFCEEQFGHFIHHTPGGSRADNHQQYRNTLRQYNQIFGPPKMSFWANPFLDPDTSGCGACDGYA